ncbi:hypothetical protein HOLleu_25885 [Holothuria leucospilota]|uniref:Uncharacterized protein n=1 Tax=Holothuria leucospilota TaxID=206669 RepID=A0A9Q1H4U4_HOLLE|nr:hypothetical protein HOLleu_25885 [Holothuria leucospilota]
MQKDTGDQPFDRNPIHQLFVYTDIIENQLVGDSSAPLLRTIPVAGSFGTVVDIECQKREYHPVVSNLIPTIEIDIRDETGNPIAFNSGRVIVTLHFRQKRSVLL